MPRTDSPKQSAPPAPKHVDGVVFCLALHEGRWMETIGVPFEHRGRTWAVHRTTLSHPRMPAMYSVSDVETGRGVGSIVERSIDAARAAAIEIIDRTTPEQWAEFFPSEKPRAPAPAAKA
ncbi:hypothetical protein WM32_08980 [Burkholderia ubonensis]|uniref:hypothetical protein n=1 Tax=Burkholderia TaxID=32008 RepID=UPI00075339E4|nr:hypothetical protein [Burkholderia ubonensis]KWO88571.1 hypothetical protein WM32_08980 [Burkholderia ubonensis]